MIKDAPPLQDNLGRLANVLRAMNESIVTQEPGDEEISHILKEVKQLYEIVRNRPERKRIISTGVKEALRMEGGCIHYNGSIRISQRQFNE